MIELLIDWMIYFIDWQAIEAWRHDKLITGLFNSRDWILTDCLNVKDSFFG